MSYTYQNLMELKRIQTRQTTIQHIKNLDLNDLNINYGINYKSRQNWVNWVQLPNWVLRQFNMYMSFILSWMLQFHIDTKMLMCYIDSDVLVDFLIWKALFIEKRTWSVILPKFRQNLCTRCIMHSNSYVIQVKLTLITWLMRTIMISYYLARSRMKLRRIDQWGSRGK